MTNTLTFLQKLTKKFNSYGLVLLTNRFQVIAVLLIFLTTCLLDQGQDMLMSILYSGDFWNTLAFFFALIIIAVFCWFFPKLYSQDDPKMSLKAIADLLDMSQRDVKELPGTKNKSSYDEEKKVPRILGTLTLWIIGLAGINIYQLNYLESNISIFLLLLIAIVIIGLIDFLLKRWLVRSTRNKQSIQRRKKQCISILVVFVSISLFSFVYNSFLVHSSAESTKNSKLLIILWVTGAFIYGLTFYCFTVFRTIIWGGQKTPARSRIFAILGVTLGAFASGVFVVHNFFLYEPDLNYKVLPGFILSILYCGLIFYLILLNFLHFVRRRWGYPLITYLLIVLSIMALWFDNEIHDVRYLDVEDSSTISINDHAELWLEENESTIETHYNSTGTKFPIILVSSHGGGIRGAVWTTLVLNELQKQLPTIPLSKNIYSFSGASGGNIGNAVSLSAMRENGGFIRFHKNEMVNDSLMLEFFTKDFSSASLYSLMGRDIWNVLFNNCNAPDRTDLLERKWEIHLKEALYTDKDSIGLYEFWCKDPTFKNDLTAGNFNLKLPLMLSNTTHVERGQTGIAAPVYLDEFLFQENTDIVPLNKCKAMPFMTAAFLSARFPYMSPLGKFGDRQHFSDGGLKENSGVETSMKTEKVFQKIAENDTTLKELLEKCQFIHICLPNEDRSLLEINKKPRNQNELLAPAFALLKTRSGNTRTQEIKCINQENHRLTKEGLSRYFRLYPNLRINATDSTDKAILPLGWEFSSTAFKAMHYNINSNGNIQRQLNLLVDILKGESNYKREIPYHQQFLAEELEFLKEFSLSP